MDQEVKPLNSIFDVIKNHPRYHHDRANEWFRQRIKELSVNRPVDRTNLLKTTRDLQSSRVLPGSMIFFGYDPKYKEVLPYYDKFPLSFIFSMDKLHFTGINFHYLSIPIRIKLYDKMWQIAKNSRLPTQQVLSLTWQLLGNVSKFPECAVSVKKYLYSHIQTRVIKINLEDWKIAIMLQNEQFMKMGAQSVARESLKLMTARMKPKK